MKAYFISDRSDKEVLGRLNDIMKLFEKNNIKIDDSQIQRTTKEDSDNIEQAYKLNMKSIKDADFVVAEVTNLSSGIGYLISTALNQKKPVLTMFYTPSGKRASTMLKGSSTNKLMFFREYSNDNMDKVVSEFLQKVKQIMDTKFILIIQDEFGFCI